MPQKALRAHLPPLVGKSARKRWMMLYGPKNGLKTKTHHFANRISCWGDVLLTSFEQNTQKKFYPGESHISFVILTNNSLFQSVVVQGVAAIYDLHQRLSDIFVQKPGTLFTGYYYHSLSTSCM